MSRQKYDRDVVFNTTLKYFNGDELASNVWINKYALKDSIGNIYELSPDDMHRRLAKEIHRIEKKHPNPLSEELIYDLIKNFKYIVPQGGPMSGIGNDLQTVSLSNCFVVGNNSDSYGGILLTDEQQVQLSKRRGGVGHDLSHIRPKGSPVKNSALTSTGIVPFMERYSNSTREVAQDGRRGALMLSISIKHPDVEDFIDAKMEQGKVTGANISVKLDDEFMWCVRDGVPYTQQYPIDSPNPKVVKQIDARKLWKKIIHNSWSSAEPGVLFWDTILKESVSDCYSDVGFKSVSTNPCAEIPLNVGDSCRLLALNLYSYVIDPFTKDARFDYELFKDHVVYAQRFMDDIVDLEVEKIDQILEKISSDPEPDYIKRVEKDTWELIRSNALKGRRTGLGITAEGDMIASMGLTYGTEEATTFSERVHKIMATYAYKSSIVMAEERGSFTVFNLSKEKNNPFITRIVGSLEEMGEIETLKKYNQYGRRNIALLTSAPTGSVSIMTQTTSGIEPAFLPVYTRRRKINPNDKNTKSVFTDSVGDKWEEYNVFHHKFKTWADINGYDVDNLSQDELTEVVQKSPYYKATSNDVDWVEKVKMQGRIQKWVDHSISVTINLPSNVTEELVSEVYQTGWVSGCKGVTIYRDGSRDGVLVSNKKETNDNPDGDNHAAKRPKRLKGEVHRFQNNLEKWIAVMGIKDGRPFEIFTGKLENGLMNLPNSVKECEIVRNVIDVEVDGEMVKKKRYDIEYIDADGNKQVHEGLNYAFNPEFWNYAKFISALMRHRMPIVKMYELVDSLNFREDHINTWKNGVCRSLKKHIKNGEKGKGVCPECGSENLQYVEGCLICKSCGHSKCS